MTTPAAPPAQTPTESLADRVAVPAEPVVTVTESNALTAAAVETTRAAYDRAMAESRTVLIQPTEPGADAFNVSTSIGPVLGWDPGSMQHQGVLRSILHGVDLALFDRAVADGEPVTVRMRCGSGEWANVLVAPSAAGTDAAASIALVRLSTALIALSGDQDRAATWALELVDLDPASVLVLDFADVGDPSSLQILAWNAAAASMLRILESDRAPLALNAVFDPASAQLVRSALFDVAHTGNTMTAERVALTDRRGVRFDLRADRLGDGALALVLDDVTASVALEERLRRDAAAAGPAPVVRTDPGDVIDLRSALVHGELEVRFQPVVDLRSRRVATVEATLRWRSASLDGDRSTELLQMAETTGALEPLTRWMLGEVAAAATRLRSTGLDVVVSANLSSHHLSSLQTLDFVELLIRSGELDPATVAFEVAESDVADDPMRATEALARLAAMGIDVTIDEFGMGYSSATQLAQLPISAVKADRSVIAGLTTVDADEAAMRSLIAQAHELHLLVAADGVGDMATLQKLELIGCDQAQGPYLSGAVGIDQLAERIGELDAFAAAVGPG